MDDRGTRLRDDDEDGKEKDCDDVVPNVENCVVGGSLWKWKAVHPFINRANNEVTRNTFGLIITGHSYRIITV